MKRGYITDHFFSGPGRPELDAEVKRQLELGLASNFREALDRAVVKLKADEEPTQKMNERQNP